jgi:hypothetical protein
MRFYRRVSEGGDIHGPVLRGRPDEGSIVLFDDDSWAFRSGLVEVDHDGEFQPQTGKWTLGAKLPISDDCMRDFMCIMLERIVQENNPRIELAERASVLIGKIRDREV